MNSHVKTIITLGIVAAVLGTLLLLGVLIHPVAPFIVIFLGGIYYGIYTTYEDDRAWKDRQNVWSKLDAR